MQDEQYQYNITDQIDKDDFNEGYFEKDFYDKKSQKSVLSRVFLFQVIISVGLLTALAGARFVLPELYQSVREDLFEARQGIDAHDGINRGLSYFLEFIDNLKPIKPSNQEESSDENVSESEIVPSNCSLEYICYQGEACAPLEGQITSKYGFRSSPTSGETEFHNGIDIAADENVPIVCIDDGTVEKSEFDDISGNYLTISHNNGFSSVYAHCNKLLVNQGEMVSKGQTIATVGSTGNSTGPHLHFGLKKDGIYIDPLATFSEYA